MSTSKTSSRFYMAFAYLIFLVFELNFYATMVLPFLLPSWAYKRKKRLWPLLPLQELPTVGRNHEYNSVFCFLHFLAFSLSLLSISILPMVLPLLSWASKGMVASKHQYPLTNHQQKVAFVTLFLYLHFFLLHSQDFSLSLQSMQFIAHLQC